VVGIGDEERRVKAGRGVAASHGMLCLSWSLSRLACDVDGGVAKSGLGRNLFPVYPHRAV
jgi:hypothetical protein